MKSDSTMDFASSIIWALATLMYASFFIFNISSISSFSIIILSMAMLIIAVWKNHGKLTIKDNLFFLYMLLWSIFCFASAIWAEQPDRAISKGITIIEILICMIAVKIAFESIDDPVRSLLTAVQWGGVVVALYTIAIYGVSNLMNMISLQKRLGTEFTNTNAVGMVMAISITLTVFFSIVYEWKWKYLLSFFCLFILIITESRTALVELIFGVFAVIYFKRFSRHNFVIYIPRIILFVFVFYFVIIFLSEFSFFSGIRDRMEGLIALFSGNGIADHSALVRQAYIRAGIEQFIKTPFFGIGIDNSSLITVTVEGHRTYLHNNYAELLSCGGLIGFFTYYSIHINCISRLVKSSIRNNPMNSICLVVVIMILISDYGTVSYYDKDTYFLLLIPYLQIRVGKEKGGDLKW